MKRLLLTCFVAIVSLAAFACDKKEPQKPAPPAAQKAAAAQPATSQPSAQATAQQAPQPSKSESETYVYDPQGRRDPFVSIVEASMKERETEKKKKGLRPTEAFEVTELKVLAIASERNRYFAMVQFPNKKYATIREGMTLGLFGGKVIKIDPVGVVIREQVKNYRGEVEPKDTILKLRKEEEE